MTPRDLAGDVRQILDAALDHAGEHVFLSAYEILDRLPGRDALIEACTLEAPGDGRRRAAALITRALIHYLADDVSFDIVDHHGVFRAAVPVEDRF